MTVSNTDSPVKIYAGTATEYPIPFDYISDDDILVTLYNTTTGAATDQTIDVDYTIVEETVTYSEEPGAEYNVVIRRVTECTQEASFGPGEEPPLSTHESAFDKLTMLSQDLNERLERCIMFPDSYSGTDFELPNPTGNAGKLIRINDAGTGLDVLAVSDSGQATEVTEYCNTGDLEKIHTSRFASYGSVSSMVNAIGSTRKHLVCDTDVTLTEDTIFPATMSITIENGGSITLGDYDLTINGPFEAGLHQVIMCDGIGRVVFGKGSVDAVYPEWFGVSGGLTDDAPAFSLAAQSLSDGCALKAGGGTYLLNTQIYLTTDNVAIDLGSAIIHNTEPIPEEVWESQTISPIIKVSANNVTIRGGHFKDCISQAIFCGGALNANKSGFTAEGCKFTNLTKTSGVSSSRCIQVRHVDNVILCGIVCENIGHTRADGYTPALSINYGTGALMDGCIVNGDSEGGGGNMLYVTDGAVSNCQFKNITNTAGGQQCTALHVKFSNNIIIGNNIITGEGTMIKVSEDCKKVTVTGNYMLCTGEYGTNYYAGVYFQGARDFVFSNNVLICTAGRAMYLSPHIDDTHVKNCIISNNYIRGNYDYANALNQPAVTYGSGIQVNGGGSSASRGPILIENNSFHNCDVWLYGTRQSGVMNNLFSIDIDLFNNTAAFSGAGLTVAGCSAIWEELGAYNCISGNVITIITESPLINRVGIRLWGTTFSQVINNTVRFLYEGAPLSYDFLTEATTQSYWHGNTSFGAANLLRIAGQAYFGCDGTPDASVPGAAFIYDGSSSVDLFIASGVTTADQIVRIYNPNGLVGSVVTNGSATAFNTSSDYRIKENVAPLGDVIPRIKKLRPVKYNFIRGGDEGEGFIAHELQEIVPQCVSGEKDAVDAEGNPVLQGIDTRLLVPLLTAGIQELIARVDDIEARIVDDV